MTPIFFLIFLLVGLKEACMLNSSFLRSFFTTSPGGGLEELKIRLTQSSLAGTGAELGNYQRSIFTLRGSKRAFHMIQVLKTPPTLIWSILLKLIYYLHSPKP